MSTDSARDAYAAEIGERSNFISVEDIVSQFDIEDEEMDSLKAGELLAFGQTVDLDGLRKHEQATLSKRPLHAALPWRLESYGRYNYLFLLDFGSFRDLQRHRNGVCQIPVTDGRFGMGPWYLQQCAAYLSASENEKLLQDIEAQKAAIAALPSQGIATTPLLNQYLYPMGTQVLVHAAYSVPQTVYVAELRSGKTVHPSLRPIAQKMLQILERDLPGMALYGDRDEDSWSAKRGEQTISSKVA
jgi:hypothetical protein